MSQKSIYNDVAISGSLAVDSSTDAVDIQCDSGLALSVNASSGDGLEVEATARGAYIHTANGIGAVIESQSGIGANIISDNNIGLEVFTNATSENYNIKIGKPSGSKILGVSSPNVSLDWMYTSNSKVGKLKAPDALSDNHVWTLPDTTGTIVLDSTIASLVTGLSGYGKTILVDAETGVSDRTGISQYSGIPFDTIAAAVAASDEGDLIYVRAGSYNIASTIDLTFKGTLYFEYGTSVNIAGTSSGNPLIAFSFDALSGQTANIYGNAKFSITNAVTFLNISGAGPNVNFECLSFGVNGAPTGKLFISAPSSGTSSTATINVKEKISVGTMTILDILADSRITINAPDINCSKFLSSAANASSNIVAYIKKLKTNDVGIDITSIGTASFYVDKFEHSSYGLQCQWNQNSQSEKIEFINTRWKSSNNVSHISATTTAAAMTTKTIRLIGNNTFCGITNTTNSITSTQDLNVYVQNAYAATAANSSIKFKVGLFTVDTDTNNFYN
jgi:hypothetical protein